MSDTNLSLGVFPDGTTRFAFPAVNPATGRLERVIRTGHRDFDAVVEDWTGIEYATPREAAEDCSRLNCATRRRDR